MLREMSFREFREWIAFSQLEPFDDVRADYGTANIVATLINLHRPKGRKAVTVDEVRIRFGDEKIERRQTIEQQQQIGKMFADLFNSFEDEKAAKRERARDRRESRDPVRKALTRG
jgi:hypothetical protein